MTTIEFRTSDHPEANGRKPELDESAYTLTFPLEDGRTLKLHMGERGFHTHTQFIFDYFAGTPSYGDGSTEA